MKSFTTALTFFVGVTVAASQPAVAQTIPEFNAAAAELKCTDQWTKRGTLDANMFSFCMETQTEGYQRAAEHVVKYAQVPLLQGIIASAEEKWLKPHDYQYEMLAFTIEVEGEAFLDISYDVETKKYSQEQVAVCSDKWLQNDEPQWSMVAFCLENGL